MNNKEFRVIKDSEYDAYISNGWALVPIDRFELEDFSDFLMRSLKKGYSNVNDGTSRGNHLIVERTIET